MVTSLVLIDTFIDIETWDCKGRIVFIRKEILLHTYMEMGI